MSCPHGLDGVLRGVSDVEVAGGRVRILSWGGTDRTHTPVEGRSVKSLGRGPPDRRAESGTSYVHGAWEGGILTSQSTQDRSRSLPESSRG